MLVWGDKMFARFEEIEGFIVKGYSIVNGQKADIPFQWMKLEKELGKVNIHPKIKYGVYISMDNDSYHYVAGIVSSAAKGLNDTDQVLVAAGRYLVGIVENGIEGIPASIEALLNVKGIKFRHAPCFEKFCEKDGTEIREIEVWIPIE